MSVNKIIYVVEKQENLHTGQLYNKSPSYCSSITRSMYFTFLSNSFKDLRWHAFSSQRKSTDRLLGRSLVRLLFPEKESSPAMPFLTSTCQTSSEGKAVSSRFKFSTVLWIQDKRSLRKEKFLSNKVEKLKYSPPAEFSSELLDSNYLAANNMTK